MSQPLIAVCESFRYNINTKICPVTAILDYISTTKSFRTVSSLFLTLTPPHAAARPATLGAWTSRLLTAAGITGFKPHSIHSASASGALKAGVPVGDVLIRGGWANPHNFFKYYAHTVQVDYSAPAVFKDFFKIQDGKGVHHYAPADPVPVAASSGDWRIANQNHPYLFTGMPKDDPVPLQYRKRLKVMVPKAAPVASRTSNLRSTKLQSVTAKSTKKQPTVPAVRRPDPPPDLGTASAAPVTVTSLPTDLLVSDVPLLLDDHLQPISSLGPISSVDIEPEATLQTVVFDLDEVFPQSQLSVADVLDVETEENGVWEQVVSLTRKSYPDWSAVVTTVTGPELVTADVSSVVLHSDNKVKSQRVLHTTPTPTRKSRCSQVTKSSTVTPPSMVIRVVPDAAAAQPNPAVQIRSRRASSKTFTPLLAPTSFPLIDKWHKMFNINLHDIPGFIVVPVNCRGLPRLKHNSFELHMCNHILQIFCDGKYQLSLLGSSFNKSPVAPNLVGWRQAKFWLQALSAVFVNLWF